MNVINDLDHEFRLKKSQTLESVLNTANYLFDQKKFFSSLQYYKRILRQWPSNTALILHRFEKARIQLPQNIELGSALAELYQIDESEEEAIDIYEDLLETDPLNINTYKELGRILIKKKLFERIITYMERPYLLNIFDEESASMLAVAYLAINDTNKAIFLYEKLIKEKGEKESHLKTLADLYFRTKQYDLAAKTTLKRLTINKYSGSDVISFLEACRDSIEDPDEINIQLINLYIDYDEYDEALSLIKDLIENDLEEKKEIIEVSLKKIKENSPELPEGILTKGLFLYYIERYSEASDCYYKILYNQNYEKQALEGLLNILTKYEYQICTIKYLCEYYKNKNDNYNMLNYMNLMLNADVTQSVSVISECKDVLEQDPQNLQAKMTMAEAYLKRNNYHSSIEIAQEMLNKREGLTGAYHILFDSYLGLKDFVSMRETFNRGKNEISDLTEFYQIYSNYYHKELNLRKEFFKNKAEKSEELNQKLDLIKAFLENEQFDYALIEVQKISREKRNFKAYYYQALAFMGMKNYHSVVESYLNALNSLYIEKTPEYLHILKSLSEAYEILGEINLSLDFTNKILALDFNKEEIKQKQQQLKECPYLEVSGKTLLLISKDSVGNDLFPVFNSNKSLAEQKESFEPSMGIAKNNDAFDEIMKGKLNAAASLLEMAATIDPKQKNILNNKAVLAILQKDIPEASKILDKIHKNKRTSSLVSLYHMAFILTYYQPKLSEAKKITQKILEHDPHFHEAHLLLGDIYNFEGHLAKAIDHWNNYKEKGIIPMIAAKRMLEVDFVI